MIKQDLRQLLTVPKMALKGFVPTEKKVEKKERIKKEEEVGKVYALMLEEGNWYVGFTQNLERRMREHFEGNGAEWTKLHKPIKMVEAIDGSLRTERALTIAYMRKYGWERVRGATWCYPVLFGPPAALRKEGK